MDSDPLPATPIAGLLLLSNAANEAISFNPPESWLGWGILLAISALCLMISGFVSGSEIAFFGLSPQELDEIENEDSTKDRKVMHLLENSERLLATILITNNLVNVTLVVLLTFAIHQVVVFNSAVVGFLLETVLLTFLLLLCGEIFPKLLARGRKVAWTRMAVDGIGVLYSLLKPLAAVMARSSVVVNRIVTKEQRNISTGELEKALEISEVSDGREKEMLEGILSFGEIEAHEIMISRVDVTAVEITDSWEEVMKVILDTGYSRIPVYDKAQDTIVGILYSKDLLPYVDNKRDSFEWQSVLRAPYFVPESRLIDDLLEDFRTRKIHIAIVVDEYGDTRGIVTLEDIIEEIVGEIDDEYDDSTSMYKKIGPDSYIFDAKIPVGDFCDAIGIDESELGDYGDVETLAGLLLKIKGDFPTLKETLVLGKLHFHVLKMERRRIVKVSLRIVEPAPDSNDK